MTTLEKIARAMQRYREAHPDGELTMSEKRAGWTVEDYGHPEYLDGVQARYAVKRAEFSNVALVFGPDDARLIAAAPCMLEALEEAERAMGFMHSADFDPLVRVRAAIDRATGSGDA